MPSFSGYKAMVEAMKKLFGTDGVRWIVDKTNPEFALRLAMAIASYFPSGARALVGRDGRVGNNSIYNIVIGGLIAGGSKVYDASLIPTPALQYLVKALGFDYGVVVTASHNPPEWVGVKLVLNDGIEAPPNVEREVEAIFFESRFRNVPWNEMRPVEKIEGAIDIYIKSVKEHIDADKIKMRRLKVVVDCANSVSALTTPRLLKELGIKTLTLNADIGVPYRPYEPAEENLEDLMKVVKAVGADFGVAHDGDGDRAVFVDNNGNYVQGDVSAVVLTQYVAEKHPNLPKRVVTSIATSYLMLEKSLVSRGIEVIWTRVGFLHIARKIMELGGALSGFEDNGGFAYVIHQPVRDGTMSAALMAELLASSNTTLSQLVEGIPRPYMLRSKMPVSSREEGALIVEELKKRYSGHRVVDIDGIRVFMDDVVFLVRPSGTEPIIRIFVEAWEKTEGEKMFNELVKQIEEIREGVRK